MKRLVYGSDCGKCALLLAMRRSLAWTSRIVVLVVIAWLAAEGRQWLLRRRAERLLADIKSFDLNHTSWSEAEKLMKRWGKWGGWRGRCDSNECQYWINLDDYLFDTQLRAYENGPHMRAHLLDYAGLRSTEVFAEFVVAHGVVISKSFGMSVASPVQDWGAPKYRQSLEASFSETATLRYDNPHFRASRPNRAFFERRMRLVANFTPEESPEERTALMNFQFDCITRWSPCQSRAELLPRANEEYEAEIDQVRRDRATGKNDSFAPTCFPTVALRAREERNVLVGDVVRASVVRTPGEDDPHATIWMIDVRLLQVLKGKAPGPVDSIISVYERNIAPVAVDRPWPFRKVVIAGMTAEGWRTHTLVAYSGDCGTVQATPENITAAVQGVAQDFGRRY